MKLKGTLVGVGVLMTSIFQVFIPSICKGNAMNAETFFAGQQLAAYRLAVDGDTASLIEARKGGVDLNKPGKDDMTMLALAVLNAHRKAIISLINAGADPNQVIPDAGSPAILAITKHYNPPRTEAVTALLDAGYDPNQLFDGTPYLFYFVDYDHWPGLELALQRGGDINVRRDSGKSLLTYVLEGGDMTHGRELIEMGADVTASSRLGETPLRAVEAAIYNTSPSIKHVWDKRLKMREYILSKLKNPQDRRSNFTDMVEQKIREHTSADR